MRGEAPTSSVAKVLRHVTPLLPLVGCWIRQHHTEPEKPQDGDDVVKALRDLSGLPPAHPGPIPGKGIGQAALTQAEAPARKAHGVTNLIPVHAG